MNKALPLLCMIALSGLAQHQSQQTFTTEVTVKVGYRYLLAEPEGYATDNAKAWPLIVFLHGAGERGDDLSLVAKHGPPKLIHAGQKIAAIIASPQCLPDQIWNPHGVQALVDQVKKTHRVDAARVYLTGLSMGGFGTWETAIEYPGTFAALVPICGGTGIRYLGAERIKHVPQWIFHGGKDTVVPTEFSQKMHDKLKALGADVRFTIYPDAAHDSWTAAYEDPALWTWLFQQVRA
jgi:predicted peptidase